MSDTPLVSVVIPAYNASSFIAETLESVFAQDFKDFEIIIVDDGSTDDTAEVLTHYGNRIQYIFKENGGTASARNLGIRTAQGKYIALLDGDDLWTKDKLSLQMEVLQKSDLAWVYGDAYAFAFADQKRTLLFRFGHLIRQRKGNIFEYLLLKDFIPTSTVIVSRTVFTTVGLFDENKLFEDWEMWLRIAAQFPVELVNKPLMFYRMHKANKTRNYDTEKLFRGRLTVIEGAVACKSERLISLKKRAIARCYLGTGREYVRNLKMKQARCLFFEAIKSFPFDINAYLYWLASYVPTSLLEIIVNLRRRIIFGPSWKQIFQYIKPHE